MCRLGNIAVRDYQESVTTRQTHGRTHRRTDTKTDAGQSDPYVPLCFAGNTIKTARCVCKTPMPPVATVYRENLTPVLFSPFSPSDLRTNLELG